jgi:hypothetical protein
MIFTNFRFIATPFSESSESEIQSTFSETQHRQERPKFGKNSKPQENDKDSF